jgi:hypothetical protein
MIRDFSYALPEELFETLAKFQDAVPKNEQICLLRFEVITPDSFMWRLLISGRIYYLYAEDFVSGLGQIKHIFDSYLESPDWQFVPVKNPVSFEASSPVAGAAVYEKPDDVETMMRYAVPSGHDFVFLAISNEKADDANFSDEAPRGFSARS